MGNGLDRAALARVEVGNTFGDDNAFPAMNADCPWVEVGVVIPSSLEMFNGTLHCATVLCPAVGTIGECEVDMRKT